MDVNVLLEEYCDIKTEIKEYLATASKPSLVKKEIIKLEKELDDIKFKLELPYKFLELIVKAQEEYITVETQFITDTIELVLKDSMDKYKDDLYLHLDTCTNYDLENATWFIQAIKDRREESKRLAQLKETALSKLTKEEKEVLGLN